MKMKNRFSLIFMLFFVTIVLMGSVSAESYNLTDNSNFNNDNSSNIISINNNDNNNVLIKESSSKEYSQDVEKIKLPYDNVKDTGTNDLNNNTILSSSSSDTGTFMDLYNVLYNGEVKDYYTLSSDYKYDKYYYDNDDFNEGWLQIGIPIDMNVTIDGNDHTIDGANCASIFRIGMFECETVNHITVTLKNINFINCNSSYFESGEGNGAIFVGLDTTVNFVNCYFKNNYARQNGGAIYNEGNFLYDDGVHAPLLCNPIVNVNSCTFEGNGAGFFGGSIYNSGILNIVSSTFEENNANARGGAIFNFNNSMGVESSTFEYNFAKMDGAAITNMANYNIGSSVNNCKFIENNGYPNGYYDGYYADVISNIAGLLVLSNSKINDNIAKGITSYGNGFGNCKLILKNCEICNNNGEALFNGNTYTNILSQVNIEQCIITNNNGGINNSEGSPRSTFTNIVNVHYNVIYDNGVNIENSEVLSQTSYVYAQYNWWGSNKGATGVKGSTVNTNNPVILTLSPNEGSTITSNYSIITAFLNKYLTNTGSLVTLSKSIPTRIAYFTTTDSNGKFSSYNLNLMDSASVSYTASNIPSTLTVKVDNQILNLNVNVKKVDREDTVSSLTKSLSNIYPGNTTNLIDNIKTINGRNVLNGTVTFYVDGNYLSSYNVNNSVSSCYWAPKTTGTYIILAKYSGNEYYNPSNSSMSITVENINSTVQNSTSLTANNFVESFNEGKNFTVRLRDHDGVGIVGQHIAVKLSNNNGQSKVYWITTDTQGYADLQINLFPGNYNAECSYGGSNVYKSSNTENSIIVNNASDNRTDTNLDVDKFSEYYGDGKNFTGKLEDLNGNDIVGQHVAINLTRLSDGASKIYWATTDSEGEFQLQINLYLGEYSAKCSYSGTNIYQSCDNYTTISVI